MFSREFSKFCTSHRMCSANKQLRKRHRFYWLTWTAGADFYRSQKCNGKKSRFLSLLVLCVCTQWGNPEFFVGSTWLLYLFLKVLMHEDMILHSSNKGFFWIDQGCMFIASYVPTAIHRKKTKKTGVWAFFVFFSESTSVSVFSTQSDKARIPRVLSSTAQGFLYSCLLLKNSFTVGRFLSIFVWTAVITRIIYTFRARQSQHLKIGWIRSHHKWVYGRCRNWPIGLLGMFQGWIQTWLIILGPFLSPFHWVSSEQSAEGFRLWWK